MKRAVAALLALIMTLSALSGCGKTVKDDSEYMRKGEFMILFTDETYITPSENTSVKLDLAVTSKYYKSAVGLVEIGYLTEEEASAGLDEAVTKEFVATLCVRNLYFRKTFDNITLKDEGKLEDPQACKDAVGHEIVSDENGYFNAYKKMTYDECKSAIDRMLYIDATSTFDEGESEIEVTLKDGVIDLTGIISEEDFVAISPDDPELPNIMAGMKTEDTESAEPVSFSGKSNTANIVKLGAKRTEVSKAGAYAHSGAFTLEKGSASAMSENSKSADIVLLGKTLSEDTKIKSLEDSMEDDCVLIRIPKNDLLLKKLNVGDMLVYGLYTTDLYNRTQLSGHRNAMCGEIVSINDVSDYLYTYYVIRVASDEEVVDSAKLNKMSSGLNWAGEKLADSFDGFKIGDFHVGKDGIKFNVKKTCTTKADSWRDAQFDIDFDYTFEVKDIKVTVDGFGSVLKGNIENAICRLDYTVVNDFNVSSSARITPDDNRNGHFKSNLSRSRLTGANAAGAKSIKIARMQADIGWGFNVEVYVYLTIEIDGSIHLNLSTAYGRGFKIINNKVTPIYDNDKSFSAEINVNAEAAVHLDLSLRWLRHKGTPWVDLKFAVGLGINCQSKVFVLDENDTSKCEDIVYGFISEAELEAMRNLKIDYCFDVTLYWFFDIAGLTDGSKIGKVIRWFDKGFDLSHRFGGVENGKILERHIEDGHKVGSCTRNYDGSGSGGPVGDGNSSDPNGSSNQNGSGGNMNASEIELEKYKFVVDLYTCANPVKITAYPKGASKDDKELGLIVMVKDPTIAEVSCRGDQIFISGEKVGSTELVVQTRNRRYIRECSITVVDNNEE